MMEQEGGEWMKRGEMKNMVQNFANAKEAYSEQLVNHFCMTARVWRLLLRPDASVNKVLQIYGEYGKRQKMIHFYIMVNNSTTRRRFNM